MHHLLSRVLTRIQNGILRRPRRVLAVSLLLVVAAIYFGSRVELRSSRNELSPQDDPDQIRWDALLEEYRGSQALIACVEAVPGETRTADELRGFTDRLAAELRRESQIENVFHRFDLDWVLLRGLHLLAPERLAAVAAALGEERETLQALGRAEDLADLNEMLAARLEREFAGSTSIPEDGGRGVETIARVLAAQREFLEDPRWIEGRLVAAPPFLVDGEESMGSVPDGYLKSHDGRTFFLVLSPREANGGLKQHRELLAAVRQRAEYVRDLRPGFQVSLTGPPALVVEEMDTVRSDTLRSSVVAVLGVALLTFLVFRWRSHALIVLASLGMGIAWALGAVWFEFGYLNMITSSFISTLIGVGVAYSIHPVSEYELEGAHTGDPVATVRAAFHRTGTGVTVAAVTTAAAFFSIRLMRFRGFGELGLVAGVGVLLCLAAAMISLPALLVVYSRWRRERDRSRPRRSPPVVDWIWAGKVAGRLCRHPRTVSLAALAVTLLAGWLALGVKFNTNIFDLLPRDAESLRYQRKMAMESDLSPLFSIVVADDLESLRAMGRLAGADPEIERFDSVTRFLPESPGAAAPALLEIEAALADLQIPRRPRSLDPGRLAASLARLEEALALAGESAFMAGLGEVAASLESARAEVERSIELAEGATDERVSAWNAGQDLLWEWAGEVEDWLRRASATDPPTLETLPEQLRKRFLTRSGRLLGFLYPAGSVFEPDRLEAFVDASRAVSSEATGFPVVFEKMSRRITSGFYRSVVLGAVLVTLILFIDYRNPRDALLALVPLAMGTIWMLAGMRLASIPFNFANMVAVPLIIGVGIDNGVHVIHRVRLEGRSGMGVVLQHTGRAILIASLTTMIGFGSLALASHRGLASLGLVLLMGVGSCLITSTLVLPNLLIALGIVDR